MTPESFRSDVIDPTLKLLDLYSPAASDLMLGTALVESKLIHRRQLGGGPARGLFQIEPATFRDVYGRYLKNKPRLLGIVNSFLTDKYVAPVEQLYLNDCFGCAIARIRYLYDPKPLPDADDIPALGEVWVRVYNAGGAGTVDKFINAYKAAQ